MIIQRMRNSFGFTLIELMIVIAIIAIFAAIFIPMFAGLLQSDGGSEEIEIVDQSDESDETPEETSEKEDGQKL